jgi:hypothetical protein
VSNQPPPHLTPRQQLGFWIYMLGTGLPAMVRAHDLLGFGWCVAIAAPLAAVAGLIVLSPAWAGSLAGAVAAVTALGLTQGWVALSGYLELEEFHLRAFLFLVVPVGLGLVPGFALYALVRRALGLPLYQPGKGPDQPGSEV